MIQRVGELVDHFESSGWPVAGAVIRMAQTLSPAFAFPTEAEVAEWAKLLKANTTFDALASALRRARSLEEALDRAHRRTGTACGLAARGTDAENLTMLSLVISKTEERDRHHGAGWNHHGRQCGLRANDWLPAGRSRESAVR